MDPGDAPVGTVIRIANPSLVVLIGAAGAGKSTFARRWFRADEILSSDAIRAELGRGEDDQRISRTAFALLHRRLAARLAAGLLTVVDATNVQAAAWRALLARRPDPAFPAIALVLELPPAMVQARNLARLGRVVPAAVVDRQLAAVARVTDDRLVSDGFSAIHRVADASRVEVARDAPHRSRGSGRGSRRGAGPRGTANEARREARP